MYVWNDRQAMEHYLASDIFRVLATNPHVEHVATRDFAMLMEPPLVTNGLAGASVPVQWF